MPLKQSARRHYRQLRKVGERASSALWTARMMARWNALEGCELVRFQWVPDECCSLEDLMGDCFEPGPDVQQSKLSRAKQEFIDKVNDEGVWGLVGDYRVTPEGPWLPGGSCFGFVGTDDTWMESGIASETIDALLDALRSRCPSCRKA